MKRACSIVIGIAALVLVSGTSLAEVKTQEIVSAIKAAFDTWSKVPCTGLTFEYKGPQTTYVSEKQGAILVYFGYDKTTWAHADNAFWTDSDIQDETTAEITKGVIALNAYKYDWSIGKAKDFIDIQTAVTRLIPMVIGFYVGPDVKGQSTTGLIDYDFVDHTLQPLHGLGAKFTYFKAGDGCTQPNRPPICGFASWTMDASTPPVIDKGVKELGPPKEAGVTKDQGTAKEKGAGSDAKPSDAGVKPDAGQVMHLCVHHTYPNEPTKGKPYHWPTVPIPYYIYVPDKGRIPGGVPVVDVDARAFDLAPAKPDAPIGGGGNGDDGCCRVSHAGTGAAPAALLVLGLLVGGGLLARRRRR